MYPVGGIKHFIGMFGNLHLLKFARIKPYLPKNYIAIGTIYSEWVLGCLFFVRDVVFLKSIFILNKCKKLFLKVKDV